MKTHHKQASKQLFLAGWELVRISKVLGISERTVSRWKDADAWEEKRTENNLARGTAEENVWELINYQLGVLKQMKEQWEKEENPRLIERGDIDALTKLFTTIKAKEHTWAGYVIVLREFVEYLAAIDHTAAKALLNPIDEYLNEKRKKL